MSAQFQLVVRSGPNVGKVYLLEALEISIGREMGNTLVISDAEVSRRHAKLTWQGAGYFIEDAGSTNGTFVNTQRISAPHALKAGDLVSLSENIVLAFEAVGDSNATVISSSAGAVKTVAAVSPATPPSPRPAVAPAPQPVYPVQPPVAPQYAPPQPAKKGSKIWIVLVVLLILVVCACVAAFAAVDYLKLWCSPYLRWLTNIISPMFGGGVCP